MCLSASHLKKKKIEHTKWEGLKQTGDIILPKPVYLYGKVMTPRSAAAVQGDRWSRWPGTWESSHLSGMEVFLSVTSVVVIFKYHLCKWKKEMTKGVLLTFQMPTIAGAQPRSMAGALHSIQVFHTGGRNQITWAITHSLLGAHWQEIGIGIGAKTQSQALKHECRCFQVSILTAFLKNGAGLPDWLNSQILS